ncbi:GspMb/PilO family protein [Massilia sp. YIM B02769]|uniref:GspMb/PilO family protein n=1 Tax=Massilia sp. YIM B02769 TaxID=3050129 RepID=UPI0025B6497F|nr:GspMb/PilO family protein [Massilia sp. YIM B02769]MDN4056822.1 GspMb/PilO family protein [Massilia sp. YIM B02769]
MNPAWIRKAAALPARQLHMVGAGLLLIVAAALWFYALRAPLAALRAVRAEQSQLALAAGDPTLLAAQLAVLDTDSKVLAQRLGAGAGQASTQPASQAQVRLVGALGTLAREHGVNLHGVAPAPDEMALSFVRLGFDVDASGPYTALVDWMGAIERAQPTLAVAGFEMHAGETPGQVSMKIRVASYQAQENAP